MRRIPLAFIAFIAACSSSAEPAAEPSDRPRSFGTGDGGGLGTSDAGADECAEETKDVFVLSEQRLLYSFHPPTLAFTLKGTVNCPTGGAMPTSMAVDRRGIAWVRHTDASLWKVDTRDLACEPTDFAPPGTSDTFHKFGMGFATASKGGSNEVLFLSDNGGGGLAKLDTRTLKLSFVGAYTGALEGKTSELTGTGEGKLYGFFVTAPAQIAEISKGTGEILSTKELPDVYAGNAWAFSFYGGDFYIYTSSEGNGGGPPRAGGGGSDVTRYRPSDGSVEIVKRKVGFKIVGAGVSTCAPTESPR
ncbi:MAG: hypothetical protein KIT84_20025 [Labilithrix sp.]|nr:hypothetical protein [Labilithrix sp.]MCW5813327.1 hypothetical protein [Labilithrix sp.]